VGVAKEGRGEAGHVRWKEGERQKKKSLWVLEVIRGRKEGNAPLLTGLIFHVSLLMDSMNQSPCGGIEPHSGDPVHSPQLNPVTLGVCPHLTPPPSALSLF